MPQKVAYRVYMYLQDYEGSQRYIDDPQDIIKQTVVVTEEYHGEGVLKAFELARKKFHRPKISSCVALHSIKHMGSVLDSDG